jgi:hypothetical protein
MARLKLTYDMCSAKVHGESLQPLWSGEMPPLNKWSEQMLKAPEDATQPQAIASSLETSIFALDTPVADATLGTVLFMP